MKDIGKKIGTAAFVVAAVVAGVTMTVSAVALIMHAADLLKDDSWTRIAMLTAGSIAATFVLFKVQWWIMDQLVAYSKKAIASVRR